MAAQTPEVPAPQPPGPSDPVAQTLALLQPWIDYVPRQQRRLGVFIFLAFLIHATAFFFIRIDATRAELRRQARTHVTMDTQPAISQEAASAGNFWDRLTDPRLFLLPTEPLTGLSSDEQALDFTAINPNISPQDLPPPVAAEGYQFVQSVVPPLEQSVAAAMIPPRQPFSYETTAQPVANKTTWQWDDALARRAPSGLPDLPSPVSDTDLAPTELRVAIGPSGTVEHVLVEQSCGSDRLDLDQQATLAARKIHFHSTDQPGLLWGRVTVFWHYAAKPREEVVPTPPTTQ
jgi:hypothetical protein